MTEPLQIDGDKLYAKLAWRIIPFMFILYIAAFLNRANITYAQLTFTVDLKLSNTAYAVGYGVFFIGYLLFEVPSNLIMEKVGARLWIARIMLTWGIISSSFMFMWNDWSFYTLRFLLGIAEAGFFPGMILYLSYWFPVRLRARMVARFMVAIPVSYLIGSPVSGFIMDHLNQVGGMTGWQWLFLLEGIPTLILGVLVLFLLTDRPAKATWLSQGERDWLEADLDADRARIAEGGRKDFAAAFNDPRIWWLVLLYLTNVIANYGLGAWIPKVIKESDPGMTVGTAVGLTAIPYLITAIVMMINGWHSDRQNERRYHIAIPHVIAATALLMSLLFFDNTVALIVCLSVAAAGVNSALGPFWALPAAFLTSAAAAGGIAVINSIGNLGGFLGPYTMGALKDTYGFDGGFIAIAVSLIVGAVVVVKFKPK